MSDDEKKGQPEPDAPTATPSDRNNVPAVMGEVLKSAGLEPGDPRFIKAMEFSLKLGSSPLPPAESVEPWEPLFPGIGKKIVEWTEKQSAHRRALEKHRSERIERRLDRGQIIAALVALFGLSLAAYTSTHGAPYLVSISLGLFGVGGPTACLAIAMRGFWKKPRD